MKKPALPVLAMDLGGTKIYAATISAKGQVIAREYHPTLAEEGPEGVISRIFKTIDHLISQNDINLPQLTGISIAAAGAIDIKRGLVTVSPHLPNWHDVPLRDIIGEKYQINTFLTNDANAAALGELYFGAGQGKNNLVLLTIGTGIGGGIIINGRLYSGVNGSAGEIGHMVIDTNGPKCSCGNNGCLEALISGTAIAHEAVRRIQQGENSSLNQVTKGKIENITTEKVSAAARNGDSLAAEIILKAAYYLGIGLVNIVNIFNPEIIIIGGGMAKMGDMLLNPAKQVVKERAFPLPAQAVEIVPTHLGDDSGVLGAAAFAFHEQEIESGE